MGENGDGYSRSIKGLIMAEKRIAFVNQRYGEDIVGGSETYARKTAELIAENENFEVEVLTTKAKDFVTWKNYYEKDTETINGVTVRRFDVTKSRNRVVQRGIQIMNHNLNLHSRNLEEKRLCARGPYAPGLVQYIKDNKDNYDAFIFVTYMYYPEYFGAKEVYDKAFFVPTAHEEEPIHMNIYKDLFNNVKGIIYLTEEEKRLVNNLFCNESVPSAVIGMNIDIPADIDSDSFKEKHGITGDYLVYGGRIEENKGCGELIEYVQKYNLEAKEKVKLFLFGNKEMDIPEDDNIGYLGFLSEEDKFEALAGASAVCLPSKYESFSISLLEGMGAGVPALVNGECEVLKGHMEKSEGGKFYTDSDSFTDALKELLNKDKRAEMGEKARRYVEDNYGRENIKKRFTDFILNL